MTIDDLEAQFSITHEGAFRSRHGSGWQPEIDFCNKKLCFVATDKAFLAQLLFDLSSDSQCYYVKYSTEAHDGMYLGRCFMLDAPSVGRLWRLYKAHPKVLCTVQDDDFTAQFRPQTQ